MRLPSRAPGAADVARGAAALPARGRYGDDYAMRRDASRAGVWRDAIAREHGLRAARRMADAGTGRGLLRAGCAERAICVRSAARMAADPRVESVEAMQVFRALGPTRMRRRRIRCRHSRRWPPGTCANCMRTRPARACASPRRQRRRRDHPDLRGQVAVARFRRRQALAAEAHGTAVAGIIAARAGATASASSVSRRRRGCWRLRACWAARRAAARPAAASPWPRPCSSRSIRARRSSTSA